MEIKVTTVNTKYDIDNYVIFRETNLVDRNYYIGRITSAEIKLINNCGDKYTIIYNIKAICLSSHNDMGNCATPIIVERELTEEDFTKIDPEIVKLLQISDILE